MFINSVVYKRRISCRLIDWIFGNCFYLCLWLWFRLDCCLFAWRWFVVVFWWFMVVYGLFIRVCWLFCSGSCLVFSRLLAGNWFSCGLVLVNSVVLVVIFYCGCLVIAAWYLFGLLVALFAYWCLSLIDDVLTVGCLLWVILVWDLGLWFCSIVSLFVILCYFNSVVSVYFWFGFSFTCRSLLMLSWICCTWWWLLFNIVLVLMLLFIVCCFCFGHCLVLCWFDLSLIAILFACLI